MSRHARTRLAAALAAAVICTGACQGGEPPPRAAPPAGAAKGGAAKGGAVANGAPENGRAAAGGGRVGRTGKRPFDPAAGRTPVLREVFQRLDLGVGATWGWKSAAYPGCVTNRPNFKLDHLSPRAMSAGPGGLTVTASPQPDGRWSTGLLSTGDSCDSGGRGFQVRTGDVISARFRLPDTETGAWPGIWTWRDGRNEIDVFEWHADSPDTLEFVNHVRGSARFWTSSKVERGAWLDVAVHLGAERVTWYLARVPGPLRAVYSDRRGVGPRFHAHLVAGMSVDDGRLHRRPETRAPFTFTIASLTVHRP